MDRIYKELPIVFPFYEKAGNQNKYRDNTEGLNQYSLISPRDALLPFQIELPVDKLSPTSWKIISECGSNEIDISNNLHLIKIYNFSNKKQAVYNGAALRFNYQTRNEPLNLACGRYYSVINFADGSYLISEDFTVESFKLGSITNFIKIDFWNEKDINPIIYRDSFRQTIYLNTFVHSFEPEIEEETEKDGFNNEIPIFQKLVLKYKFTEVVPDYVKIALISLQMHDHVLLTTKHRNGEIDRVQVTAQPHEGGGFNDVEVVFEDNIIYKTNCDQNENVTSVTTW